MGKLEEFLSQIDALESLKKQAIEEVLRERRGLDATLARLGYQAGDGKRAKREQKACRICGEMGHNAARHRGGGQGGEKPKPAPPPPAPRPEPPEPEIPPAPLPKEGEGQATQGG